MKKLFLKLTFVAVFLCPAYANSQFLAGGQLNYSQHIDLSNILNGPGMGYAGIGLFGDYGFGGNSIKASLNFGLPFRIERSYDLMNSTTFDYDTTIGGFERYRFFTFAVDYKYYLVDGDAEIGGFYFFAGGGLTIATITNHPDDFDESTLETTSDYSGKSRIFQPVIRGGAGYEHAFNFGNIFVEPFFNIPANQLFGVSFAVNLPMSVGIQAGIKIPVF